MGLALLLQNALADIDDRIDAAFVFGSMASGDQSAGSDLDVCVLGDVSLLDVVKALSPIQDSLRREINPVIQLWVNFAGLIVLMILIVGLSISDIAKMVS